MISNKESYLMEGQRWTSQPYCHESRDYERREIYR